MFRTVGGSSQDIHRPQFQNAIVTACIGDDYLSVWQAMCQKSWINYCAVHQFDLIVVTDHLDNSERGRSRSPSWEKLLVLVQPWAQQYERVVWVDADIIISHDAPNIIDSVPDPAKVGICLSGGQMSEAERHIYFERIYRIKIPPANVQRAWQFHCGSIFERIGASSDTPMFNGGVLVMSPWHHAMLLRSIYERDHDFETSTSSLSFRQSFPHAALHTLFRHDLIGACMKCWNFIFCSGRRIRSRTN